MPSLSIKQDDRRPLVEGYSTDQDDVVVPLTGASSCKFIMRKRNSVTPKVNATATIVDAATGHLKYAWAAGDTDTVGRYLGEFEVTFSDGTKATFPSDSYIEINVVEDVA